ncbi:short-chain alcohol dehydrogenase [Lyophyllum atratum]|nr:short-chain alcohol dehydrogenase [Lyophyllum atratum]
MAQTIFITGASSGIGLATAKLFFEKGWNVVATMRSPEKDTELTNLDPTRMLVLRLDVQDRSSIAPAIDAAIQKFQRINLLLNNAGYGQNGIFESITREQVQEQFDVNLFGVMDVTRAILPHFRAHGGGGIINISSGCAFYGLPMLSVYTASKFALEGFTESLAFELASQNIFVKSVIPHGAVISTNFAAGSRSAHVGFLSDETPEGYKRYIEKTTARFYETLSEVSIRAGDVAEVVFEAATDGRDRLRYPLQGIATKGFVKARYESKTDEDYVEYIRSVFR